MLKKLIIRISLFFIVYFILWLSSFWAEHKSTFNNPIIIINGSSDSNNNYLSFLENDKNIYNSKIKKNKILEALNNHPYVKISRSSYRYPDKLIFDIKERSPFAIINNNPLLLIDREGVILPFKDNGFISYNLPVLSKYNTSSELYPIGKICLSVKINDTVNWLDRLQIKFPELYEDISEISLADNDEIILILIESTSNPPIEVLLGNNNTLYKLAILKKFKEQIINKNKMSSIALLDIRYDNQIIVKQNL